MPPMMALPGMHPLPPPAMPPPGFPAPLAPPPGEKQNPFEKASVLWSTMGDRRPQSLFASPVHLVIGSSGIRMPQVRHAGILQRACLVSCFVCLNPYLPLLPPPPPPGFQSYTPRKYVPCACATHVMASSMPVKPSASCVRPLTTSYNSIVDHVIRTAPPKDTHHKKWKKVLPHFCHRSNNAPVICLVQKSARHHTS